MLLTAVIFIICAFGAQCASLPSTFKRCKPKNVNFNKCLEDSIHDALHQLRSGLPAFNIPSIDPLVIPSVTISTGTAAIRTIQQYKNFTSYGFSNTIIENVDANLDKNYIKFNMIQRNFSIEAEYDVNGNVLMLPIYGKGPCKIFADKVLEVCVMKLEKYSRKNKKYIKALDIKCTIKTDGVQLSFENFFNGDKMLIDALNKVMETNGQEIINDVSQNYADTYATVAKDFTNRIFNKVPLEEIFPSE